MYYLFEFTTTEIKSEGIYVPIKCYGSIDPTKSYNADLIDRLNHIGIVTKYQHKTDGWINVYIHMQHESVIHGDNYDKLMYLVREFERGYKIDNLISENI